MISNTRYKRNQNQKKPQQATRIIFALTQIQKNINFNNIITALGKIQTFQRKKVDKFNAVQKIISRKVKNAFLNILTFHRKLSNKSKATLQKLSLTVLAQITTKLQRKNINDFITKLKNIKPSPENIQIYEFSNSITYVIKSSNSRSFCQLLEKLERIKRNQRKMQRFSKDMDSLVRKTKNTYLSESFQQILKFSFLTLRSKHLEIKKEKVKLQKNSQLLRNQQLRNLKTEILASKKALELEQSYKNKSKRQDYERTLIIQTKNAQSKKMTSELQKFTRENHMLTFQLNKLQNYVETRKESKGETQGSEVSLKLLYGILTEQNTKQNMSMRQLLMMLQRNKIDLTSSLKAFSLSKQKIMLQNIDFKNLIILYEKQINGQTSKFNITASETYKKTFEENENLREAFEVSFLAYLSLDKEILANKNELNKVIESHHNLQKGSNITLTTPRSSRRITQ